MISLATLNLSTGTIILLILLRHWISNALRWSKERDQFTVHNEFLLNFKKDCEDYLNFHLQNADRSKCPRQSDFNSLYIKNCQEHFGGKNDPEMSCNLEEWINDFMHSQREAKRPIKYMLMMEELL